MPREHGLGSAVFDDVDRGFVVDEDGGWWLGDPEGDEEVSDVDDLACDVGARDVLAFH